MDPIARLLECGQSLWLDYIDRRTVAYGTLQRLVDAGIRGVTTNPSIFHKAIGEDGAYEALIHQLLSGNPGMNTETLCAQLMIGDVQSAADILKPVYDASDGGDGYVSLEISPGLAYDADGSIAEAHRLWNAVKRPNLMIKVPGTQPGLTVIEKLLGEGINVNVTLLFSVSRYGEVVEAWLRGLARNPDPARTASVASFFISRIDTLVDARLESIGTPEARALQGRVAVACARLAYQVFQERSREQAYARQAERGARPQRLLWASTSTKNPGYRDVIYVEELIGSDTVNTVPLATLEAFRDHGRVDATLGKDLARAQKDVDRLADFGIELGEITAELEADGVRKFAESHERLMELLNDKRCAKDKGRAVI